MASTQSPIRSASESPQFSDAIGFGGSTLRSARSVLSSLPISLAFSSVSSWKRTVIS
jgi:hypothetical protein